MQAVIFDAPGEVRIGDWPDPIAAPGEAIVSVSAAGVCASDRYVFHGKHPYNQYPIIGGHEIAGEVVELGEGVEKFAIGDRVVVEPFIDCGNCYPCRIGKPNCCANLRILGLHQPGGFAERVAVPVRLLHRVPDALSPTTASFAEPLAIGIQACRRAGVNPGEYTLILGCGPIGLALTEIVRTKGARPVVVDVVQSRLDLAAALGTETILAGEGLVDAVLKQTDGEGAPVVIEATGSVQGMESTVELVAAGGRVVIVGLVKKGLGVTIPGLDITRKEMTILGSRASVDCFPEAIKLLSGGGIHSPDFSTSFDMWDGPQVFERLASSPESLHKAVLIR